MQISAIIPTYNRADYLGEAIASIRQQALPPLEIIVVDDGSTDETPQIVAGLDPPVRYVRQENAGVAAARNRGLLEARGDVIAWLDSDDLWEPDFLQIVAARLADPAVGGVYTGLRFMDEKGDLLPSNVNLVKVVPPEALYRQLLRDNFIPTPSMVVRKACYEAAGPFDPELRICEDSHMWLRLAQRFRLVGIAQPLVRIRVHPGNTMGHAARFCHYRLLYVHKLFGPLAALPSGQHGEGRLAYAYAYRSCAFSYLQAGGETEAWQELAEAGRLLPAIWSDVELYYELLCGPQPRGRRGDVAAIDVPTRLVAVRRRLNRLGQGRRRPAYGNLYLAGAMLCDTAGQWRLARAYLLRALFWQPHFLGSRLVLRRLIKLILGKRMSRLLKTQLVPPGDSDPDAISVSVEPLSTS